MSGGDPSSTDWVPGFHSPVLAYRGRNSQVFKAVNERTGAPVAVKVMHAPGAYDEIQRLRDLAGARGLVPLLDIARTAAGEPALVMPFQPDGSYADVIARSGPVGLAEAVRAGRAVAGALAAAHARGLLHNDVVPGNVLRAGTSAVLTDLGSAAAAGSPPPRLRTSSELAFHAPPEILRARTPVPASDVYALASTLWTLVAGRAPFSDGSGDRADAQASARRALREPAPPLPADLAPAEVGELLAAAMAKDPEERPATPAAFEAELERAWSAAGAAYLADTPSAGAHPPAPAAPVRPAAPAEPQPAPPPGPGGTGPRPAPRPPAAPVSSQAPAAPEAPTVPAAGAAPQRPSRPPAAEAEGPTGPRAVQEGPIGPTAPPGRTPTAPVEGPTGPRAARPAQTPAAQRPPAGPPEARPVAEGPAASPGRAPAVPSGPQVPPVSQGRPGPGAGAGPQPLWGAPGGRPSAAPSPQAPPGPEREGPAGGAERAPAVPSPAPAPPKAAAAPVEEVGAPVRRVGRRPQAKPTPLPSEGEEGRAAPAPVVLPEIRTEAWALLEGWSGGPDSPPLPGSAGSGPAEPLDDGPDYSDLEGPARPPRWRRHLHIAAAAASVLVVSALLGVGGALHPAEVRTAAAEEPAAEEKEKDAAEDGGKGAGEASGSEGKATAPQAPGKVWLEDGLTVVQVKWEDASGGTARYFVVGGVSGQPQTTLARTGPGVEEAQVPTGSETAEYCFTVVAVDGLSAPSAPACTNRAGARAQAQAEAEKERAEQEAAEKEEEEKKKEEEQASEKEEAASGDASSGGSSSSRE
ncbi:protein kinase domain-containing protein [Nocardiopsis potens]|uniref:protein kinase domain-containing protein n=1 Tax=Nocardiopsis potens TaxID=1246458 RepID=UPI00034D874A|nr:protein kinase [Nocardiopsis potens]